MRAKGLPDFRLRMRFREAIASWRNFPSIPATYMLVVDSVFEWGSGLTDILYIGQTKHMGTQPNNNRLWDYYTRATAHERGIRDHIDQLESAGKNVEIIWRYEDNESEPRRRERELLNRFRSDHNRLPRLNKR